MLPYPSSPPLIRYEMKAGGDLFFFPLTNSVQEQFGFGGEVVVDDVVQQGDVYTASSNIGHEQHHGFPMHKFPNIDLSGSLIEGTVDVSTLHTFWGQQLKREREREKSIPLWKEKKRSLHSAKKKIHEKCSLYLTSLRYSTWCLVAAKTTVCSWGFTTFLSRWSSRAALSSTRTWKNESWGKMEKIRIKELKNHNFWVWKAHYYCKFTPENPKALGPEGNLPLSDRWVLNPHPDESKLVPWGLEEKARRFVEKEFTRRILTMI